MQERPIETEPHCDPRRIMADSAKESAQSAHPSTPEPDPRFVLEDAPPGLEPRRFRSRFRGLIFLTWTIPPLFGLTLLQIIGMFSPEQMLLILTRPIEPLFDIGSLILALWLFAWFVRPIEALLKTQDRSHIGAALARVNAFPMVFWTVFVGYLILAPSSVMLSAELYLEFTPRPIDWLRIHLVALMVSILVGLPIFFLILDLFGRALANVPLRRAQVKITTKVFLIATLSPLLIDTMLVQYYWTRTGYFTEETFAIWVMLEMLAVGGALIFMRSFGQSLSPLESVLGGPPGRSLAPLLAQSTDELGLLANQFRAFLEELEFHGRVHDISNRILRATGSSSTLDEVLPLVVDLCQKEVPGELCLVALCDESCEELVCVARSDLGYWAEGYFRLPLAERTLVSSALERGEVVTSGEGTEVLCSVGVMQQLNPRSVIVAPMKTSEGDVGVLVSLRLTAPQRYRERDRRVIRVLADEAALAIDTVSLRRRRQEAEERIRDLDELARVSFESITDGLIVTDVAGRVQHLNPVASELAGKTQEEARGLPVDHLLNLTEAQSGRPAPDLVSKAVTSGRVAHLEGDDWVLHRAGGHPVHVALNGAPLHHPERGVVGVLLALRDVTEVRSMARTLSYQAAHDDLTGLVNRREFEARLQQALETVRGTAQQHALVYMDLDQFKVVNDTCGHRAGDALLAQLAAQLQPQVRRADTLGRLGGDEFGILLWGCPLEKAWEIAEQCRKTVEDFRFTWGDKPFRVGVSMGLVPIEEGSVDVGEVLSAADSACYIAKEGGGNRIHLFQPDDLVLAQRRGEMQWAQRLRRALDEQRLRLYLQPIRTLRLGASERRFSEILLRMIDEDGQLVPPEVFLAAAERYRVVTALDRWVVRTVVESLSNLAQGPEELPLLAVNVSGQSLSDDSFIAFLVELLEAHPRARQGLCFEITETAAIADLARTRQLVSTARDFGCRFALDDFGSGLSSFAYLQNLPVDYLKIDGNFVVGMASEPVQRAIVEAINQIGHVLGIETIAEWVEDEKTLELLRALGVDHAQGFATGIPRPLASTSGGGTASSASALAGDPNARPSAPP